MPLAAELIVVALIVALLTAIAVGVEVLALSLEGVEFQASWKIRAGLTKTVGAYFVVMLLWNALGTCLVLYMINTQYPKFASWLGAADYLLAPFVGVFMLGLVLTNTNVTIFNKGIFAFQNWVERIRGPALTSVKRKHVQLKSDLQRDLESEVETLPDKDLQAYLLKCLGEEELQRLEQDARQVGADSKKYKVMQLVERCPEESWSLAQRVKRQRRQQKL